MQVAADRVAAPDDDELRLGEELKRHRRRRLKERGAQALDLGRMTVNERHNPIRGDGSPVDQEPLSEVDQVRRRIPRRGDAGGHEGLVHHRRDRALAVGAGDVDRGEAALGMIELRAEPRDVVEAEFDAERFEGVETVEQTWY